MSMNKEHLTALQTHGIRWVDLNDAKGQNHRSSLSRKGGAGPTDHKALNFASQTSMVPIYSEQVNDSPFHAEFDALSNEVNIFENNTLIDTANVPAKPKFYDLETEEGIPYWKIATLHSKDVLATTVLQTCVRYRNRRTSCQFCAIEESLENNKTIAHKTPEQLAEVAKAAVELDGITQMIMTTGTPKGTDRGAAVLLESTRAVRAVVDIPIQVQCEPPAEDHWFQDLKDAGADALGMHLEAVSDRVRQDIMPGKATVPMSRYISAYKAAVKVFGVGNVSTYILAGLGDTEEEILTVSEQLIALGVYPFVVPFVPVQGTPLENHPMPDEAMLNRVFSKLGPMITARGMASDSLSAGCAKCGACSSLKSYENSGGCDAKV